MYCLSNIIKLLERIVNNCAKVFTNYFQTVIILRRNIINIIIKRKKAMKEKFIRFMYGRYGSDNMNNVILITALVLSLVLNILGVPGNVLLLAALIYTTYRMFSRNIYARLRENEVFMRIWSEVPNFFKLCRNKWRDRRTFRYIKCKKCKNTLRLPRGKGEITVTCPVCKHKFDFCS